MNSPRQVINYVNAGHFIVHYAMLIFAAAVVLMAPVFGMSYAQMLPCATPGFLVFGAGSLATGWLGDRWSRRHMMVVFFIGIGLSMIATALVNTPLQLTLSLFAIGAFAAIYHPVGTAMLVSYAEKRGREVGINGVWGNLGVAFAALATGALCQWAGWRWAFALPGLISIAIGIGFLLAVQDERVPAAKAQQGAARISSQDMKRVIIAMVVTVIASSTTFNAVTVVIPKLFEERLAALTQSPALIGFIAAGVYLFGALAQYVIGNLIDRHSLKSVFLPMAFVVAPLLAISARLVDVPLVLVMVGIIIGIFGQVTINDAMVAKYTNEQWRSRAYAARYFIGFTAAGASVALVAWLHERGGSSLMLQAFAGLNVLIMLGAMVFPNDRRHSAEMEPVKAAS